MSTGSMSTGVVEGAPTIMEQHPIGQTGAAVSALGFGGASAGNLYTQTTDADAAAAVDRAWAGGIRYFDTAPHYGLGLSERRLGAALRDRPRELSLSRRKWGGCWNRTRGRPARTWRRAGSRCRTRCGAGSISAPAQSGAAWRTAWNGSGLVLDLAPHAWQ